MNDLELKILEVINQHYPAIFEECILFTTKHKEFMNTTVLRIYKEINFYLSCSDFITSLKQKKYNLSYPEISNNRCIEMRGLYDVNLASKSECSSSVVTNDFLLNSSDYIFFRAGRNSDGIRTYLIEEAKPLKSSYALDLYQEVFYETDKK